jgi:hypothetical protein
MKDELLVNYSIRLRPDQIASIKQLSINFSSWARNRFDEEFTSPEEIDKNINNLQEQIDNLKIKKNIINKKIEEDKIISKDELDYLLETKELLSRNPDYLDGRISLYTNKFLKSFQPTRNQFLDLLKRAERIKEEMKKEVQKNGQENRHTLEKE